MPVSSISVVGVRFSTSGASRWIGQRSSVSTGLAEVDRLAEQVEDPAQRRLADRDGDRPAGVDHLGAAREAVGRVHRDRAHAVVAEVLLHLADERAAVAAVDRDRVVDLGQLVGEDGLDHDALDLLDAADVLASALRLPFVSSVGLYPSASAPATTSMISCVISAWRARFICSVRPSISSPAFSEALRIAVMRAPCSDAVDSSSARKTEIST